MSLVNFKVTNHPQQIAVRGALDEIDDRRTDPEFVYSLEREFGAPFTLDVAASSENAKAPVFYSRSDDGLSRPWPGRVWCNPPYSDCRSWVQKAWTEWRSGRSELIAMLLPANRTEQAWWQELIEPERDCGGDLRTRFLRGRMRFERPSAAIGPKGDRPPFGCVLLIWGGNR